jgi:hypothetical protein
VAIAHCVWQNLAHRLVGQLLERGRPVRKRQREQGRRQIVGQRLPDRPAGQRSQVVGDGVDERVAGPPERVQVTGAEGAGARFAHLMERAVRPAWSSVEPAGLEPATFWMQTS